MEIYDSLLGAVCDEYDRVTLIKKSERGEVTLIRHRASGNRYIFRHFSGSSEVYRKLLTVSCPNLPQIMEVGEKEGKTALLEEYVQGDTLGEILQGGLLTAAQAKQITRQLCMALWVLHSLGVVHRDVKPDNVIIRGTEAVLIDFDASRIYKNENREDTQILGTTGFAAPEQYGLSQSDGRADIYALGVLLNIMLTGEHPSRKLASGRIAVAYNPTCTPCPTPGIASWPGLRCPVAVALSEDGGLTFPMIRYMERGEGYMGDENKTNNRQYEYPYIMQGRDGRLHLAFAYKDRLSVKYMSFTEEDVMGKKRETVGLYNPTSAKVQ